MRTLLVSSLLASILHLRPMGGEAAPQEDLVTDIPFFGPPPTAQYSGYLNGTDGCDTDRNGDYCMLHYWYVEAETTSCDDQPASEKPVVLWLNGGPGCSSMIGYFTENGPLLLNATGGLMQNPWSWNKVANVLYLEAPVGVGYSYCANQADGRKCVNSDRSTASTSRAAVVDFFTNKFPELAANDFYIAGESYAGVYIPTLAKELQDNAPQINLKGLAVGDPCTADSAQIIVSDPIWYSHKYGLIDDALFETLWHDCGFRFWPKAHSSKTAGEWVTDLLSPSSDEDRSDNCTLAAREFFLTTSQGLSQEWKDRYVDDYSLFAPVSQIDDEYLNDYMNRQDVKEALHVLDAPTETWGLCSGEIIYKKQYSACSEEDRNVGRPSMIDFYRTIVPNMEGPVWVYNGDTDPCVSYEGTRKAIEWVGFPQVDGGSYRPWFYNQTGTSIDVLAEKPIEFGPNLVVQDAGVQFGGDVVNYEHGLSFLTVHGSGHMVPQFRPQAAFHMISKFLQGEDLSPPYPSDEDILSTSLSDFMEFLTNWTETAKAAPYVTPECDQD